MELMLKKQNGQFRVTLHLMSSFVTHYSCTKNMIPSWACGY